MMAHRKPAMILILPLAFAIGIFPWSALGESETPQSEQESMQNVLSGFDEEESESGEEEGEENLESGFEDESDEEETTAQSSTEEESFMSWGGFVRLDTAYNYEHEAPAPNRTDFRGLSKLRVALRLEATFRLGGSWEAFWSGQAFHDFAYRINGRDQYADTVLDGHEQEAETREFWVGGSPLESLDFKFGRQIVAWGKSDNIRVVDILNPIDFREPGLTDIADLRLPLTMTRLDYYFGDWGLTAVAIHEIRFDKNPAEGSDFFPTALPYTEEIPEDGGENTEYALALSGIFSGWDLAFYWAQVFDDTVYLRSTDFKLAHARITMVGIAANVALGNWLLKSEAAQFSGLQITGFANETFSRIDALVGVEYSGFTDTTLSLEAVNRQIADLESEDVNQYVFTYRGSFLREQLDLVAVLSFFGASAEEGSLQRYSATYELASALDITGGVVIFTPGNDESSIMNTARDNDRLFFDMKWSF